MSIESWKDLGTPERIDDAITDMGQAIGWLEEAQWRMKTRMFLCSEAADDLREGIDGVTDIIAIFRAHISEAEEAKASMPDYDATDAEKSRHARGRG